MHSFRRTSKWSSSVELTEKHSSQVEAPQSGSIYLEDDWPPIHFASNSLIIIHQPFKGYILSEPHTGLLEIRPCVHLIAVDTTGTEMPCSNK